MPDQQAKIWGHTTEIFRNASCTVHYLEIKKGGYCSEHRHEHKSNVFFVISGILEITTWDDDVIYRRVLYPNTACDMYIGLWHKFTALTDVKCIEMYNFEYDGEDIERRSVGGIG